MSPRFDWLITTTALTHRSVIGEGFFPGLLLTTLPIFCSNTYAGFFNQQPPSEFLKYNLRIVYHGMGDGGTEITGLTLEDFINLGLGNKGKWKKSSDSEWIYKMSDKDQVTHKKSKITFVFSRIEDSQLSDFFKNDVILTRVVFNGNEMQPKDIWITARVVISSIDSSKIQQNNKENTDKTAQTSTEEQKKIDQETQIKNIEEQKINDEQAAAERIRRAEEQKIRDEQAAAERIRKAEEQKREDEQTAAERLKKAAAEEQERLAQEAIMHKKLQAFEGHYINSGGGRGGAMDVRIVSETEIIISGASNGCILPSLILENFQYNKSKDQYVGELNNNGKGKISFIFRKFDANIAKIQKGEFVFNINGAAPQQYCEKGGTLIGSYPGFK